MAVVEGKEQTERAEGTGSAGQHSPALLGGSRKGSVPSGHGTAWHPLRFWNWSFHTWRNKQSAFLHWNIELQMLKVDVLKRAVHQCLRIWCTALWNLLGGILSWRQWAQLMVNLNDTSCPVQLGVPQPPATAQGTLLPPALKRPQQHSEPLQEVAHGAATRTRQQKGSCIENGSDSTTSPSILLGRIVPHTGVVHPVHPRKEINTFLWALRAHLRAQSFSSQLWALCGGSDRWASRPNPHMTMHNHPKIRFFLTKNHQGAFKKLLQIILTVYLRRVIKTAIIFLSWILELPVWQLMP